MPNRRDHGLLSQIGPVSFANSLCRLKKNTFTHGAPGSQFMCAPYTIERLDQGRLYPLGEHRDKHVTVGARTSDPLHSRRVLYPKSYLDSLFPGYSEPLHVDFFLGVAAFYCRNTKNKLSSQSSITNHLRLIAFENISFKICLKSTRDPPTQKKKVLSAIFICGRIRKTVVPRGQSDVLLQGALTIASKCIDIYVVI